MAEMGQTKGISEMNRKDAEYKRRSPKDIKWGRTFRMLSRYDICVLGHIYFENAVTFFKMSDEQFDKWLFLGEFKL
jgi:hypothetical protein